MTAGISRSSWAPSSGWPELATPPVRDWTAWHRADLGVTLATGVSGWADQGRAGHDFSQATAALQAAFTAEDSDWGRRPSIVTDGVDDRMRADTLASVFTGNDSPYTVMHAVRASAIPTNGAVWSAGSGSSSNPYVYVRYSAPDVVRLSRRDDAAASKNQALPGEADTLAHLLASPCSGTTVSAWRDGAEIMPPNNCDVGVLTLDRYAIAALVRVSWTLPLPASYAEQIVWGRELRDDELLAVQVYEHNHFGTALA